MWDFDRVGGQRSNCAPHAHPGTPGCSRRGLVWLPPSYRNGSFPLMLLPPLVTYGFYPLLTFLLGLFTLQVWTHFWHVRDIDLSCLIEISLKFLFVCLELYCSGFKIVKYLNIFVLVLRASFCRKCCAPFIRHLSCACLPWNGLTILECHCHFWSSESQCQPCFPQVWTVDYLCLRHSLESSITMYLGLSVPARA